MVAVTTSGRGASGWASPASMRERFGIAPNAPFHGSSVSAGYPAAPQHGTTLGHVAARKDDVRVQLPRGRQR